MCTGFEIPAVGLKHSGMETSFSGVLRSQILAAFRCVDAFKVIGLKAGM